MTDVYFESVKGSLAGALKSGRCASAGDMAPAEDLQCSRLGHLPGGNHLVCQRQNPSLRVSGKGGQGKHMADDSGTLPVVQVKTPASPAGGQNTVGESMHSQQSLKSPVLTHVTAVGRGPPVIEKKIVKQSCPGDSSDPLLRQTEVVSQAESAESCVYGMVKKGVLLSVMTAVL